MTPRCLLVAAYRPRRLVLPNSQQITPSRVGPSWRRPPSSSSLRYACQTMRVFVSSTCYDLLDARAEVERCLRDLGLTPLLSDRPSSEFEVLPDVNSIETCLANVRGADAVVCLLSQRYGPSLKSAGYDDVSATYLEWREARACRKPLFLYARDRLMGEHAAWKRSAPGFKPAWVKDVALFEFLDEHTRLVAAEPGSNWAWPFRDSVELAGRLAVDFKAASNRAILARWIAEGRLPLVRPRLRQRVGPGGGQTATFDVCFPAIGSAPAFDLKVRTASASEWTRLGDATPGTEPQTKLGYTTAVAAKMFEGEFSAQYSTDFGAVIEDTYALAYDETKVPPDAGHATLKRRRLVQAASVEFA